MEGGYERTVLAGVRRIPANNDQQLDHPSTPEELLADPNTKFELMHPLGEWQLL